MTTTAVLVPVPEPPKPDPIVRLEMSKQVATTLLSILNRVGGGIYGPRGDADSISYALLLVGIVADDTIHIDSPNYQSHIYLKPTRS